MSDAYVYMKFKLERCANAYEDAGLMTLKQLRNRIVHDKFLRNETLAAAQRCAAEGRLDLYHVVDHGCGHEDAFKDPDPEDGTYFDALLEDGYVCGGCGEHVVPDGDAWETMFAVSNRTFGERVDVPDTYEVITGLEPGIDGVRVRKQRPPGDDRALRRWLNE